MEGKDFSWNPSWKELHCSCFSLRQFWCSFLECSLAAFFLWRSFNPHLLLGRHLLVSSADPSASWFRSFHLLTQIFQLAALTFGPFQHRFTGLPAQILQPADRKSPLAPGPQLDPLGLQQTDKCLASTSNSSKHSNTYTYCTLGYLQCPLKSELFLNYLCSCALFDVLIKNHYSAIIYSFESEQLFQ